MAGTLAFVRRLAGSIALVGALTLTATSAAALQPIQRRHGEVVIPRVRAGTITVPTAHRRGRITVILTLADPPLAAYSRTLTGTSSSSRLSTSSLASKAYVAKLQRAQRAAAATLKRAIPEATVRRNYTILLNGMAVDLPATELARAAKLSFAHKLYPSYRYTLALDRSPGLIGAGGAGGIGGATGGDGVKIAVVDDGVDPANRFFAPEGFSYPAGFPKGGRKWTTPKVIVARSFVGTGADDKTRLALDPDASFHGTHVAGIAAGNAGTTAPAGADHPETPGLSGVAPRAQIGNYRVFNVPTPAGHVGNTPEIVAAFEAAVRDGMDVINFSGGGPQVDPASDAIIEAVRNVAAAGVVPVISAGNDRDDYGLGSAGSPGTAPDAISVAAVSNSHVYGPALTVTAPGAADPLTHVPFVRTGSTPPAWANADQQLVDVGTIMGTNSAPVPRDLCGPAGNLNGGTSPLPAGSLSGAIALVSRGNCTFAIKAARVRAAGAVGIVLVDNRPGEANGVPVQLAVPSGMISDFDGSALRSYLASRGGRDGDPGQPGSSGAEHESQRHRHELLVRRADGLRTPAEAGRRRTGRADPLGHAQELRRPLRRLRRNEHGRAARRRRCRPPPPAPSGLDRRSGQVGARVHRCDRLGGHGAHGRGAGAHGRLWADQRRRGERSEALHGSGVALVRGPERDPRCRVEVAPARCR